MPGTISAVAVDEADATGEVLANQLQNILRLDDPEEAALAGVAAGPEGHLAVLHDKARVREVSDVADMVVVEVGQNDVPDGLARDAELAQPLGWGVEKAATSPCRRFGREAAVDGDRALRRNRGPDEEIHGRRSVVRIVAVEPRAVWGHALRVLEGIQLVRASGHKLSFAGNRIR